MLHICVGIKVRPTCDAESTGIWLEIAAEVDLGHTVLVLVSTHFFSAHTIFHGSSPPHPFGLCYLELYVAVDTLFYTTYSSGSPSIQPGEEEEFNVTVTHSLNPSPYPFCTPNLDTALSVDTAIVVRVDKMIGPSLNLRTFYRITSGVDSYYLF